MFSSEGAEWDFTRGGKVVAKNEILRSLLPENNKQRGFGEVQ
jgi:hypothetical protein